MKIKGEYSCYRGTRVLVIGAAGFIGRWVAKLLSEEAADLWLIDKSLDRLEAVSRTCLINGHKSEIDLAKPDTFEKLFAQIKPDITFNLAGYGISRMEKDEEIAWNINSGLVAEMAMTIARGHRSTWNGMKLVHVGSGFEYGSIQGIITEKNQPEPTTVYGKSKLAGTEKLREICELTGLKAVTARLFTVYGPGEYSTRLLPSLIRTAKTGEILQLTKGEQERDFTYVRDVAMGLLKLGLSSNIPGNIINLASGKLSKVREFVECTRGVLKISPEQLQFGAIPYREDEVWQGSVDVTLLKNCISWIPSYSILKGIKETVKFVRAQDCMDERS